MGAPGGMTASGSQRCIRPAALLASFAPALGGDWRGVSRLDRQRGELRLQARTRSHDPTNELKGGPENGMIETAALVRRRARAADSMRDDGHRPLRRTLQAGVSQSRRGQFGKVASLDTSPGAMAQPGPVSEQFALLR